MPSLLKNVPVSDEQRRQNDRHRPWVVIVALAVLSLYLYLFTSALAPIGLPAPQELAAKVGIGFDRLFDDRGAVDSNLSVTLTRRVGSQHEELFVLFAVVAAAFLSAYFLPLRLKQPALAAWTALALVLLYGPRVTAGLLAAHLAVYLVLHPRARGAPAISAAAGLACAYAFYFNPWIAFWENATALAAGPIAGAGIFRFAVLPLLHHGRAAPWLRTVVVQSAVITVCAGAIMEGITGVEWKLPLAVLLFFWQWARVIMYHLDFKDGQIPEDVSLARFLAVFWSPGALANWNWGVEISQGYAYTHNSFLCEDKNKLVLSGVKMLGIALFYLLIYDWFRLTVPALIEAYGVATHEAYTRDLVEHFVAGGEVSTASVLTTTMLDLARWTILWGGVVHFKVGVWRMCGYRTDSYFHHPWLSTNLAVFWSRFTFHYREFLVRAFYYPVFFRFFKGNVYLRVFVATLAAAAVGNMVWGHFTERVYYRGMELEHILYVLGTWPYYVLLASGIAAAQLYGMRRRRRRKPWTFDRWIATDVLAAYCTLQFYALIIIFVRPVPEGTVWDLFRLFLIGFGIRLDA